MRKQLSLTLLGVLLATTVLAEGERKSELFNFDWKFKLGETVGAEKADFDDSQWRCLDLPHDFQIEMPWNDKANRSRGFKDMATGWYRKTFAADPTWRGHRVVLDFEGIMLHGDAYLNGQRIGGTDYGYLGFEADVTKLLKYDRKNVLSVHCSTDGPKLPLALSRDSQFMALSRRLSTISSREKGGSPLGELMPNDADSFPFSASDRAESDQSDQAD